MSKLCNCPKDFVRRPVASRVSQDETLRVNCLKKDIFLYRFNASCLIMKVRLISSDKALGENMSNRMGRTPWAAMGFILLLSLVIQFQNCDGPAGPSRLGDTSSSSSSIFNLNFQNAMYNVAVGTASFTVSGSCSVVGASSESISWALNGGANSAPVLSGTASACANGTFSFTVTLGAYASQSGTYTLSSTLIGYDANGISLGSSQPTSVVVTISAVVTNPGGPTGPTNPPPVCMPTGTICQYNGGANTCGTCCHAANTVQGSCAGCAGGLVLRQL